MIVVDSMAVDDSVVVKVPVTVMDDVCVADWLPLVDGAFVLDSVAVAVDDPRRDGWLRVGEIEVLSVLDGVLAAVEEEVCVEVGVGVPMAEADSVPLLDDERDGVV